MTILVLFGYPAIAFLLYSVSRTAKRQYVIGLLFGFLELVSTILTAVGWKDMLYQSGKTDWYLLGIHSNPFPAVICYALFITSAACIALNIGFLVRHLITRHETQITPSDQD